ncbi:MAG: glycosyltransferase family 4 protein [Sulfolobaceae archaeon]
MSKKIAIIGDISSLVKENESGGEVFEHNVIKRLSNYTDTLLIPTLYDLLYIINNENIYREIVKLSSKVNISDIIFDVSAEKFEIEFIIKKYLEEIKSKNIYLLYQPDYFAPHAIINTILKVKAYKYLPKLIYGEIIYISDKLKLPSVVEIHGIADISFKRVFTKFLKYKFKYNFDFNLFNYRDSIKFIALDILHNMISTKLIKDNNVKKILVVSKGVLDYLGIKNNWKVKVMKPSNAVDEKLISIRNKSIDKKQDYAVFFARLIPFKGILEIPYILNILRNKFNIGLKVKIFGKFYDNYTTTKFYSLINKFHLEENIEYLGFVPKQELYEIVSKAKLMIYPSHSDAFSLSILESLALGTPVVAYDIAGPKSVFTDLSAVKFSREFDVLELAKKSSEILRLNEKDYFNLIENEELKNFIKLHSNWDRVTMAIYNEIISI